MSDEDKNIISAEEITKEANKIKNDFIKKMDVLAKRLEEIKIKNIKNQIQ